VNQFRTPRIPANYYFAKLNSYNVYYGSYIPNKERVEIKYLWWFLRSAVFREIVQHHVPGGIKTELKATRFLSVPVLIPPLEEQRRIVEYIELLNAKIALAKKLRQESARETTILGFKAFDEILESTKHEVKLLETLLSVPLQNGLSIPASGIGEHGVLFAKVGIVNSGTMNPKETKRVDIDLPSDSTFYMKPDDIFISRGNSLELVGRAALYHGIPENCAFPDLLIRVRVDKSLLEPQYLIYYLQTVTARKYIESQASGTSPSMKKVSQPKLERMPIPVPPLDEQRRIVAYLDSVQARLASLRELQAETQEELDALLPSVLDKAFKGEL
jgi:type I restriction enzyme S subunit